MRLCADAGREADLSRSVTRSRRSPLTTNENDEQEGGHATRDTRGETARVVLRSRVT